MDQKIKDLVAEAERKADDSRRGRQLNRAMYFRELDVWARKVRRDILVIEYHLKKLGVNAADFYGDPGDPPPPPDEV